jgi:hypothetical protein
MNISRRAKKRLPFLLDFFNCFYTCFEEREQRREEIVNKFTEFAKKCDVNPEMLSLDKVLKEPSPERSGSRKTPLSNCFQVLSLCLIISS